MSQFSKEGQEKTNSTREETGFFLCHLFFLLRIQAKLPGNSAFRVYLWGWSRQNYFQLSPLFIMYNVFNLSVQFLRDFHKQDLDVSAETFFFSSCQRFNILFFLIKGDIAVDYKKK